MDEFSMLESTKEKAVRSMKWSASMEVVSRLASPVVMVVLARLLVPEDFGVVATAMIVITFGQMFWDAGLSKALIQTEDIPEEAGNVVFWTNTVFGLAMYALLFFAAPRIADFFNIPTSTPVLRVLGLQIVIASLSSVQHALFVRDLDFRRLFWIKLTTALVPGLISIPMAFYGFGVWALVTGALIGQILNLFLLWFSSTWRPRLHYDRELARKMMRFGLWVLLEALAAWLLVWGDTLIVGKFLGMRDLGFYQTGWMLVTMIFGIALNPFLPVLYPTFSRMQNDLPGLKESFHKVNRVVMALSLPIGVGLFWVGPEIATVFFGENWHGLGFVLSMLGLTLGLGWPVAINAELYRAIGRPEISTKLLFVATLLYMPAYVIAAHFSLEVFLCVRLGLVFVGLAIHAWVYRRTLTGSFWYLWHDGKVFILAAIIMGAAVGLSRWGIETIAPSLSLVLVLGLLVTVGIGVYSVALWLLDRSFIAQTFRVIKRAALT